MQVSEALDQVRDDLLETSAAGLATDARIIRALNEGMRHLHNLVANNDPNGEWLGQEATYTYPANTRWANLSAWSGAGSYPTNRIISLVDTSRSQPEPIDFADPRAALRGTFGGRISAVVKGDQLGLRLAGTDTPPGAAIPTRMIFIPAVEPIALADTAKWIGQDYPFPSDFAEAIVAYAVVRIIMQIEAPSNDWQARYAQLERTLLDMIQQHRKQTFTSPVVTIENAYWC